MAMAKFRIIFAPEAHSEYRKLKAYCRSKVRDAIEKHLSHQPERVSKSRIKRLKGLEQPKYRLRVDEIRIFYDVIGREVHVLAIVEKTQAMQWLDRKGRQQ
jgi:mRNA-degrading endonuclease RelE of RelBE toxin-antitoxin system